VNTAAAPRNVWLVAGTSLFAPYPCRCAPRRATGFCDPTWCPCGGRLDVWNFAQGCCAWWATPAVAAAAQRAYSASRGWS
jgi:hypothetical protein